MFRADQQIGSYTLIAKLGRGGFGEVWLAEKRSQLVTKKVALKLPHEDQVNIDAIRQEAELWEQASGHANVLPIIDADVIDGQVVIVSEFADGGSLADRLKTYGKPPPKLAVELTIGILSGLEFLHRRKIIHRDIKPANILLQGATPRLADFGISRAMQTTAVSSAIIGTDAYMSPESFDGKRSIQTDIWSVGVVLYQLLAGSLPFPQEHPSERMFAIFAKDFAPLPPEIPQNLQHIVQKALAKQPENRYQTTSEMRDDLQKALIGISHPTFAPTEVFQARTENLPTISTAGNNGGTAEPEKETVVSPPKINVPPTEAAFQPPSVVTHFNPPPVTTERAVSSPPPIGQSPNAQFQIYGKPLPQNVPGSRGFGENRKLRYLAAIAVALTMAIALTAALIIGLVIIGKRRAELSNSANNANNSANSSANNANSSANNANNSANNANNSANNAALSVEMNIELATTAKVFFIASVDGQKSQEFFLSPGETKSYNPRSILELSYSKVFADQVQLKINGKTMSLPAGDDAMVDFKILKYNLDEILRSGKIPQTPGRR